MVPSCHRSANRVIIRGRSFVGIDQKIFAQHVLLASETATDGISAWPIPIRSQSVFVCGVAHSLVCECTSAQAETGSGPIPANPSATNKLRVLRTLF